jgi:ribosomal-protein-alanine N-acetyltransferase
MKALPPARILPLSRTHIPACREIVAASDPWKRLGEGIDFSSVISREAPYFRAYVCIVENKAVGFIVFASNPVFAQGGYLRALGVSPSMRRRGIGKKLLAFAEQTTARHSRNFYLCVSSFNRRAQAFYRALGYTRVGNIPELIRAGASEYIFWKRLRAIPQTKRRP